MRQPEEIRTLEDYRRLPFTTKDELSADGKAHPPYGTNLTFPLEQYIRIHQTSGTTGEPLRCLDTEESWNWWGRCWEAVYNAAGVTSSDRIFFAFSFGPFIGFWSAYEGAPADWCAVCSGRRNDFASAAAGYLFQRYFDTDLYPHVCLASR